MFFCKICEIFKSTLQDTEQLRWLLLTITSDSNGTVSNSQEETPSNEEIKKLGKTSTENVKEHES